jgi:hypothetical protein
MEETRQARQLILSVIPARRRENIERDPATSWGLDNLLMNLNLAVRFSEETLQQPITERMEANVLTLTCFRNSMLESVHAGEPALSLGDPDTLAALTRDIAVRLRGLLAIHDESELARMEFLAMLWNQFIACSHRIWCSRWVVEPAHSTDDLLTIDVKADPRSEPSELAFDPDRIQLLLDLAAGKPVRLEAHWGLPSEIADFEQMEANALVYWALVPAPAFEQVVEETIRAGCFGDSLMKQLMIQTSERLMHLLHVRHQYRRPARRLDHWLALVRTAHETWCSEWTTE